ncbi:Serine/threonine-protein kinase PrkC [Polystyrenella longa]|uniref:Serine/threonine-protein kinase PrkC n=1 Tax=Polystyrenella longa TaxID=2528007 RepID=A0A518CGT3_9PLAN|nr:serine/threonine-protein kinase [Polystyrenella longa]QDU78430.1 Serine/threonine-protein kinase PrkC [Polystyrenella longa]
MSEAISAYQMKVYGVPDQSPADEPQTRDLLEILLTQYLEELRKGTLPAIDVYVKRYPHLAEEINEVFPIAASMEQWKSTKDMDVAQREQQRPIKIEKIGPYQIVREIGRGGMGVVFEAVNEQSGHRVALKLLLTGFAHAKKWRERFQTEARLAARLQHTNIVSVLDFGESDGSCYYAMQLVEGMSLHWLIKRLREPMGLVTATEIMESFQNGDELKPDTDQERTAPVDESRCLKRNAWKQIGKIGIQVAKALQHAHQAETLHRDIKPSNLLLDPRGNIRITDFGLAQQIEEQTEIQSAIVAGTLRYMAPECLHGVSDERSDIYSFGATLYELTTLHKMIPGDNPEDVIHGIQARAIAPPRSVNPEIPRPLEAIIDKATQLLPEDRYQTARHIKRDIARFLRNQPVEAPPLQNTTSFRNLFSLKK